MPAVSDSQFAPKTTQPSVLALESVETASLGDGDMGVVRGMGMAPDTFYVLDVENILPQNGTSVLWTRNSNPLFGAPAGTPGRWVLMSTSLGCSCPTGPTGPAGEIEPLSRTFFVDPLTTTLVPDGSIANPFPTIAAGIAALQALPGGPVVASLRLTAGTYLEPIALPDVAVFDQITLVGEGPESTIVMPAAGSALTWAPTQASSPAMLLRLYGLALRGGGTSPAVTIDGSGVPGGLFPSDLGNTRDTGLQFDTCTLNGLMLTDVNQVEATACRITPEPGTVEPGTEGILLTNVLSCLLDGTDVVGNAIVTHNDPTRTPVQSLSLIGSSRFLPGLFTGQDGIVYLVGTPRLYGDPSATVQGIDATFLTAAADPARIVYQGTVGTFDGTSNGDVLIDYPDDHASGNFPFVELEGATIGGLLAVNYLVSTLGQIRTPRFRACDFTAPAAPGAYNFAGPPIAGSLDADLSGSTFPQSSLSTTGGNVTVLRDRVVFPDVVVLASPAATLITISPRLPGATYAVTIGEQAAVPVFIDGKGGDQFTAHSTGAEVLTDFIVEMTT